MVCRTEDVWVRLRLNLSHQISNYQLTNIPTNNNTTNQSNNNTIPMNIKKLEFYKIIVPINDSGGNCLYFVIYEIAMRIYIQT